MRSSLPAVAAVVLAFATVTAAQIEQTEPFEAESAEDFESFNQTFGPQIDVFDGEAVLSGTTGVDAIFVLSSSTFFGLTVRPRTGGWFGGGGEPVNWTFGTPVHQFGGYFASNSGAPDAVADFFDTDDNLIDSRVVTIPNDQSWQWNGWISTVPIKRITITGNGINQGFIDYDDMRLSRTPPEVPTMSLWATLTMALLFLTALTIKFDRLTGRARGRPSP